MNRDLSGSTAIVTGASRGFGRAISTELASRGAMVVGVARSAEGLEAVKADLGQRFTAVVADAADPAVAHDLLAVHRPSLLVLNAGATPVMGPVHEQTWESFSVNWAVDVQHAFHWTRAALRLPLQPGSRVVAFSSGAAVNGSPMSGGYAPAKAAVRFLAAYARDEAARSGQGVEFVSVLPQLTPATGLGQAGVSGYARRQGVDAATLVAGMQPVLTPEQVGRSIVDLLSGAGYADPAPAYLLTAAGGLQPLP